MSEIPEKITFDYVRQDNLSGGPCQLTLGEYKLETLERMTAWPRAKLAEYVEVAESFLTLRKEQIGNDNTYQAIYGNLIARVHDIKKRIGADSEELTDRLEE